MTFAVKLAIIKEKQLISTLIQPYLDELSHFPDEHMDDKDKNGTYHYSYLDAYWRENTRYPYLLYSDNKIAGFALVRQNREHWEMAEFYVLPEFRRRGLGTACAVDIFRKHPGNWEIHFNKHNQASRILWQNLADRLSRGAILVCEYESDTSHDCIRFLI